MSSSTPGGGPGREVWTTGQGGVAGAGEGGGGGRSAAAAATGPPPSVAALSDASRLSVDSHHSYYSQRSRWSTSATVATTVAPRGHLEPLDPEPLPEELGAASSRSGSSETGAPAAATAAAGAGDARSHAGTAASTPAGPAAQPDRSSSEIGVGRAPSALTADTAAAAAAATAATAAAAAAGGVGATRQHEPPIRLVVFHPDGKSFGIGVDKQREGQLREAAQAAAAQRRQQQRAAAVAMGAAAGSGGQPGARGGSDRPGGMEEDELDSTYPGWRHIFTRQKNILVGLLASDILYLTVLLVLRLVWGNSHTEPQLSTLSQFFVGNHPESTSISYLAGSMFTDCVALYGALQNYASVITLFIVWSVVLGAFAILEMPLLFIIIRLVLLVAAFQLRFSMARLRNLLPPTSIGSFFSAAGRSVASGSATAWGAISRPFRRQRQEQTPAVPAGQQAAAPAEQQAARAGAAALVPPAPPGSAALVPPAPPGSAAAQLAAARSSALFRAAIVRMMSEQRRTEFESDLTGGAGSTTHARGGALPAAAQAELQALPHPQAGGAARHDRRSVNLAAGGGASSAGTGGADVQAGGSIDRLFSRIMSDIAAVAATPASSSARRRQRRRERDSRRLTAAAAAAGAAGSNASAGASSSQQPRSPRSSNVHASSSGGSSGEEDGTAGPSSSSRRQWRSSSSITGSRSESAVSQATAAVQRSAGGGGTGEAPPSWQDLLALLNYHSQQQQHRRQRQVDIVPLVSLDIPPPADPPSDLPAGEAEAGAATPSQPSGSSSGSGAGSSSQPAAGR